MLANLNIATMQGMTSELTWAWFWHYAGTALGFSFTLELYNFNSTRNWILRRDEIIL